MPVLKLHSEQSVAAHVAKGWTLNRAFHAGEDREAYEYLMERAESGFPRASSEEIAGARRACIVEDVFEVQGRGVVVAPGIPVDGDLVVADGDLAVVISRQRAAAFPVSPMVGRNLGSPCRPMLLRGASREEIEVGSSVWIPHRTNREQAGTGQRPIRFEPDPEGDDKTQPATEEPGLPHVIR